MTDAGPSTTYDLFATAIAGRPVSVRSTGRADAQVFSDGRTIFTASKTPTRLEIITQAALIGASSLDKRAMLGLLGREVAARRYLYLELMRAAHAVRDRLPSSFTEQPVIVTPLTATFEESLRLALGTSPLPDPPIWAGALKPFVVLRQEAREGGIASVMSQRPSAPMERQDVPTHDDDQDTEPNILLKLLQNPFGKGGAMAELFNDLMGAGVSRRNAGSDADAQAGAEMPVGRIEQIERRGTAASLARTSIDGPVALQTNPLRADAVTYPEWHFDIRRYRPDWTSIETVDAWRPDGPQDLDWLGEPPSHDMRRELANLKLDHRLHPRQPDGANLDEGALLDAATELATGHSLPALNIYRASRRSQRDLGVMILIDISGSTGEEAPGEDSVFIRQLRLASSLGRTLSDLGDMVSMAAFHSWGRQRVRFVRLKEPDERWSGRMADRLRSLEPLGYTRTGAAIRHGTHLLKTRLHQPHSLLILISDGLPYDQDYEHAHAGADTRKALQEARQNGVACVCVSVGSRTEVERLNEIFGEAGLLSVDDVAAVPRRLGEVLRSALATASARPRQRRAA